MPQGTAPEESLFDSVKRSTDSHEREKQMSSFKKDEELISLLTQLTEAQRLELFLNFPNLAFRFSADAFRADWADEKTKTILADLARAVSLNKNEAKEALREDMNLQAPPLTEIQRLQMGVKAYFHSIDVLKFEPGDDPDAFEEDLKDRRRSNPLAKQPARRLMVLYEETRRRFPDEFRHPSLQKNEQNEHQEVHPTSMLPPENSQFRDDLLQKLSTMEKEQK